MLYIFVVHGFHSTNTVHWYITNNGMCTNDNNPQCNSIIDSFLYIIFETSSGINFTIKTTLCLNNKKVYKIHSNKVLKIYQFLFRLSIKLDKNYIHKIKVNKAIDTPLTTIVRKNATLLITFDASSFRRALISE